MAFIAIYASRRSVCFYLYSSPVPEHLLAMSMPKNLAHDFDVAQETGEEELPLVVDCVEEDTASYVGSEGDKSPQRTPPADLPSDSEPLADAVLPASAVSATVEVAGAFMPRTRSRSPPSPPLTSPPLLRTSSLRSSQLAAELRAMEDAEAASESSSDDDDLWFQA